MPKHYGFLRESRLDAIEAEYERLLGEGACPKPTPSPSAEEVARIIGALDDRGAWVEEGVLDAWDRRPDGGIISSATFIDNVRALARFIEAQ
jgi:hypothetical protein